MAKSRRRIVPRSKGIKWIGRELEEKERKNTGPNFFESK
jgi:hypothetical protein